MMMRREKEVLGKLKFIMFLAIIVIFFFYSNRIESLRENIALIFPFFNEKAELLSNIFIGIFSSTFCMYIGEVVNYKYIKRNLEREIRSVFDKVWIELSFYDEEGRERYLKNSQIILSYQEKIMNLYSEYDDKSGYEYTVIKKLNEISILYKYIYQCEFMKTRNTSLLEKKIKKIYSELDVIKQILRESNIKISEYNRFKKELEDIIKELSAYVDDGNKIIDEYIEKIKIIEPDLEEIYKDHWKNDTIFEYSSKVF